MPDNVITINDINKLRNYGLHLISIKDKKPVSKRIGKNGTTDYSWKFANPEQTKFLDYSNEELLKHDLGINHEAGRTLAVDCDCDEAVRFQHLLPDTLTVSSVYNGTPQVRQKIYKLTQDVEEVHESYPKANSIHQEKDGTVIEELTHTQSWIGGGNRFISNDVPPTVLNQEDYDKIRRTVRKVYSLSMFARLYPKKDTFREEFRLTLAGLLNSETTWSLDEKKSYVKELCKVVGDKAVNKALEKIGRVEKNIEKGKHVWSTEHMAEILGRPGFEGGLDFVDAIRDNPSRDNPSSAIEEPRKVATGLNFLNGHEFTIKDFPKPQYLLYPIVAKQQIRQVFAPAGTGKSLYTLHEAGAVASGYDFMHFKNPDKIKAPTLIVEGEMDSSQIQKRLNLLGDTYEMEGKILNLNYMFFATLAIQKDMHFESLTTITGRKDVEITAQKIEKLTGQKPVIYLDNITALTLMQEKEGADWVELMHWLSRLRNQGYHVTFLHHPTKQGATASGSNIKERSIDIDMKLTTPDEKTVVEDYEENHTQMIIEFLKWREHMNTFHSKKRIAIINRTTGKWLIVPMLNQTQRKIWQLLDKGKTPEEIIKAGKDKDGMSKANVYKVIKILKQEGVLDDKPSK